MAAPATDLLVIGGGPAGLATAIRARLAGMSVRVIERARPPIDKACGEGLMPDAVSRLEELGVELGPHESCRFRGIRYLDGEVSQVVAEGVFPGAGGMGVRRLHLHQALARRAAELGVELCWGVAARGLAPVAADAGLATTPEPAMATEPPAGPAAMAATVADTAGAWLPPARGAYTDRAGLEIAAARWVVGADGLRSRVRQWAGLAGPPARRRRFGVRRHFACPPWSDLVEVYWGPGCEAYVTPVGSRLVGVAMLWSDDRRQGRRHGMPGDGEQGVANPADGDAPTREPGDGEPVFDRLLAHFPALASRLAGAPAASRDRGIGPLLQRVRGVCRSNVALIGDAAGYVDAITGEGLAVALHQSAALIEVLAATPKAAGAPDLARYAAAHRRIGRLPDNMTALVLAIERRPWLRRRAVRALAAEPALFSRLLGIHARALPPARLGIDGALRLVYRLVKA
jgi:flavin-dependent dehydrogenase